jgi:hypothetical protein
MSAAENEVREMAADQSLVQLVSKAELDQQISTARAFPRSLTNFQRDCRSMATLNERVAGECVYALPRDGKSIEGPSARLAEIVVSAWGNCRAGARVVDEGREFITAQGVFQDLERNTAITYEVRRRITDKNGRRFKADMIGVTANAACSIALRNAVFKGVPKALWSGIYEECRKVIAGDSKTLANRRAEALTHLQKLGATKEMVFAALGVKGVEDIGLDQLVTLGGWANAIKEGETTVEEAFAPKQDPNDKPASRVDQAKDALKGGDKLPYFDLATARGAIAEAKSVVELEEKWKAIVADYSNTKRDLPIELEAARSDRRSALEQKL